MNAKKARDPKKATRLKKTKECNEVIKIKIDSYSQIYSESYT